MDEPENVKDDFAPRLYQIQITEAAVKNNTIIYLPTGSGKTYIAVMVINRLSNDIVKLKKKTIFLVNTVPLVEQHHSTLSRHTDYEVGKFSGDQNVDFWTKDQWITELAKYQIIVFTSQIFLDILRHGYFNLEDVNLLIFDECHQAVNDQPMRQLMQLFVNLKPEKQPRVLGLTATLLNGNCSLEKVQNEVLSLETTFHSKVATVREMAQVIGYSTNPHERIISFDNKEPCQVQTYAFLRLRSLITDLTNIKLKKDVPKPKVAGNYSLMNETKNETKIIIKLLNNLQLHIEMFGIFGAWKACLACLIEIERMKRHIDDPNLATILAITETGLTAIKKLFSNAMEGFVTIDRVYKFSSHKVLTLIEVLRNASKKRLDLHGIVFVRQRFTAKILYYIIKALAESPEFSFIRTDFMVGFNAAAGDRNTREMHFSAKTNKRIVSSFHKGEINLLIASNVVEEGVDIPRCTLVVKFDRPMDYRSYIQSKGRARSGDSLYVMLVSQPEYTKFISNYKMYQKIEELLQNYLVGKTDMRRIPNKREIQNKLYEDQVVPPYYVDGPDSAQVAAVNAISLLNRYCQSMTRDKYSQLAPLILLEEIEDMFVVTIELPIICPIRDPIEGPQMPSKLAAKRTAALEACKLLHQIGELNNRLLPKNEAEEEEEFDYLFTHWLHETNDDDVDDDDDDDDDDDNNKKAKDVDGKKKKLKSKSGTKKCVRQYKIKIPDCLIKPPTIKNYYLHPIIMTAKYTIESGNESNLTTQNDLINKSDLGFALLTFNPIPEVCDFPLFLSAGELSIHIDTNYAQIEFNDAEIADLRRFNHFVFNDLLRIVHDFLVYDNTSEAVMMLSVPIRKSAAGWTIDLQLARENTQLVRILEPEIQAIMSLTVTEESHFGKVVCPWYRMNDVQYLVTKVCTDLNALSDFPSYDFETYADYYKSKYSMTIRNPTQPLLLVKGISQRKNCLLPRSATLHGKRNKQVMQEDSEEHLIPEMCVVQQFPGSLWYKATCLPSVMHRVMCLLRAECLRRDIITATGLGKVQLPNGVHWDPLVVDPRVMHQEERKIQPVQQWPIATDAATTTAAAALPPAAPRPPTNKDYSAKMRERMYPWKDEQEPTDIERNIDTVTKIEIEDYERFVTTKLHYEEVQIHKAKSKFPAITLEQAYVERPILMLQRKVSVMGPQLSAIFQCLMSTKANDIVSLERLETLGDSFLKLSVSMYLLFKYPQFNEGRLTNLKSKIIGNQNLLYCGLKHNLGGYMKISDFSPATDWLPPSYCVPKLLKSNINEEKISVNKLFEFGMTLEEQLSGNLTTDAVDAINDTIAAFQLTGEKVESTSTMSRFLGYQNLADKTVSDCTEALIGAYLQSNGIIGGLSMLNYLGIIPKDQNIIQLFNHVPPNPVIHPSITNEQIDYHICNYEKLEEHLGYSFRNRAYLLQALTHASFAANRVTDCYQRLEFLGDAVLDFLITCHIYEVCDNLTPGQLTDLRSALVNNVTFASLVVKYGIHKHLKCSSTKLMDVIDKFVKFQEERDFIIDEEVLILLENPPLYLAEIIHVPKVLGDLFESLAGAVFLDTGMDLQATWLVFHKLMWNEIESFRRNVPKNPVRMLHENVGAAPEFGPVHMQADGIALISCTVMVNGRRQEVHGFGDNKQQAKRAAAKLALRLING